VIDFNPKSENRVGIRLTHYQLKSKKDQVSLKDGWQWAFDSLKSFLEKGVPISVSEWEKKQ